MVESSGSYRSTEGYSSAGSQSSTVNAMTEPPLPPRGGCSEKWSGGTFKSALELLLAAMFTLMGASGVALGSFWQLLAAGAVLAAFAAGAAPTASSCRCNLRIKHHNHLLEKVNLAF